MSDPLLAGPDADILLARAVMGWSTTATPGLFRTDAGAFVYAGPDHKDKLPGFAEHAKFRPTREVGAAFQLVQRAFSLGLGWLLVMPQEVEQGRIFSYVAYFVDGDKHDAGQVAEAPALAVSRAVWVAFEAWQRRQREEKAKDEPAPARLVYGLKERLTRSDE